MMMKQLRFLRFNYKANACASCSTFSTFFANDASICRPLIRPRTTIFIAAAEKDRYYTTHGNGDSELMPQTEQILTLPNVLCALRIIATPFIGALVLYGSNGYACIFFVIMGFTDMLDGLIARRFPSQRSLLGSIIDPVADKFLISTLFVTLTYVKLIPVAVTAIVLSRDLLLLAGGLIRRYRMLEPPITVKRFFDTTVSSVRIMPTRISKLNTMLQLLLVSASLASPVLNFVDYPALIALQFLTVGTTIFSGFQYVFQDAMLRLKKAK